VTAEGGRTRSEGNSPASWRQEGGGRPPGSLPVRKLRTAVAGLAFAVGTDFSVRHKLILSAVFLLIAGVYETLFHFLFLLAVTALMLVAEMFNTAIEEVADYIQPNHDLRIKAIKDTAAAATMVAIVVWWTVIGVVAYELLPV